VSTYVKWVMSTADFPSLTEDYNLELQYRKPFLDIWEDEKNDRDLGPLSERMGVRDRSTGALAMTEEEKEAVSKCYSNVGSFHLLTRHQASTMHSASTRSKWSVANPCIILEHLAVPVQFEYHPRFSHQPPSLCTTKANSKIDNTSL
jgi:hypothetical protein